MKHDPTSRTRVRYRPRHAPPTGLTLRRSAACLAILSGVALFAGVAGNNGPASGGAARAEVPHTQAALDAPALAEVDSSTAAPGAENPVDPSTSTSTSSSATEAKPERVDSPASGLAADGIPSTALAAYRGAAVREAGLNASCGLTWPLLAGIGRVESDHGRFAGAVLHSDGLSTPPVVGIPLDGNGTAVIEDTDGGALDGDTVYDRAVGPMQFIPSTWAGWGVDANHDGLKDPFNVFDAAAAAADYLCAAGRDLTTTRGQVAAILSYNWSWDYVRMVMGLEQVYASGAVGLTVPVLPTSADPYPHPGHGFPVLPPVDPGKPRGAGSPDSTSSGTGSSGPRSAGSGSGGATSGGAGSGSGGTPTVRPTPTRSSAPPSSASSSSQPPTSVSSSSSAQTSSSSSSSASGPTDPGTSTTAEASSSQSTTTSQADTSTSAEAAPVSSGP